MAGGSSNSTTNASDHMLENVGKAPVSCVNFAPQTGPNSLYLTTAAWDGNVSVYEVQHNGGNNNNRVMSRPLTTTSVNAPVLSSVLTADGECYFGGCNKGVYLWNVAANSNPAQIGGHTLPVSRVAVLGPGAGGAAGSVVSAGWDAKACFWDPRQSSKVHEVGQPGPITDIDVVGPAVALMTGRSIALFDLRSMSIPMQFQPRIDPVQLQNRCVGLGSDLDFVVSGTVDGRIWRTNFEENNKQDQFKAHGGQVRQNEFDAFPVNDIIVRGKTAISCSSDGTICFFDLSQLMKYNPNSTAAFPSPGDRRAPITSIALSDDNRALAYSVSEDYTLGHNVAQASRVVSRVHVKIITSELRIQGGSNDNNNNNNNNNNNRVGNNNNRGGNNNNY